jgi:REP element-mobilizing transposase RayT
MTQRHFIQNEQSMLVTSVTKCRRPIFADDACAREAVETLFRVKERHPFFLYAFAVMPDHCHFVLRVPQPQFVSRIIGLYKLGVSHNVGKGTLWQSRFHQRLIGDIGAAIRYVESDPMRSGIVEAPQSYPWSSASGLWEKDPIAL